MNAIMGSSELGKELHYNFVSHHVVSQGMLVGYRSVAKRKLVV
jgi:hypothetical protein